MVLDEGSIISNGIIQGIEKPVAVIGIAEKGYVSLELIATHVSGHSSMPQDQTTIGKLSKAIISLERYKMDSEIIKPVQHFFNFLGPEMSIQNRFLLHFFNKNKSNYIINITIIFFFNHMTSF